MEMPLAGQKSAGASDPSGRKRRKKKKRLSTTEIAAPFKHESNHVESEPRSDSTESHVHGSTAQSLSQTTVENASSSGVQQQTCDDLEFPLTKDEIIAKLQETVRELQAKRILAVKAYQTEKDLRITEAAKADQGLKELQSKMSELRWSADEVPYNSNVCVSDSESRNGHLGEESEHCRILSSSALKGLSDAERDSMNRIAASEQARERAEERARQAELAAEELLCKLQTQRQNIIGLERRLVDAQSVAATAHELQDELKRVHDERQEEGERRRAAERVLISLVERYQSSEMSADMIGEEGKPCLPDNLNVEDIADMIAYHVEEVESSAMADADQAIACARADAADAVSKAKEDAENSIAQIRAAAKEDIAKMKIEADNEVGNFRTQAAQTIAKIQADAEQDVARATAKLENALAEKTIDPSILERLEAAESRVRLANQSCMEKSGFPLCPSNYDLLTDISQQGLPSTSVSSHAATYPARTPICDQFLMAELDTLGLTSSATTISLSWWCLDFGHVITRPPELLLLCHIPDKDQRDSHTSSMCDPSGVSNCSSLRGGLNSMSDGMQEATTRAADRDTLRQLEETVAEKTTLIDNLRQQLEDSSSTCKSLLDTVQEQEETIGHLRHLSSDISSLSSHSCPAEVS